MPQTAKQISEIKQRAVELLNTQSPEAARDLLIQLCNENPDDAEAWFILAGMHAALGSMHDVVQCCNKVISLNRENAAAHYNLGLALASLGEHAKAINSYRDALNLNPEYLQARAGLGRILRISGRHQEAIDAYTEALALSPDTPLLHYELGLVYHDVRKYEQAESCYRRALQINPGFQDAHYRLGSTLLSSDQFTEAINHLEKALQQRPDDADILFQIGNAHFATGNLQAAAEYFQHALRIEPAHYAAANNLGKVFEQHGDLEKSEQSFRYAIKQAPDNAMFHCNLGRVLTSQRDFSGAEVEFRKTLSLDPGYTEAYFGLGQVYSEFGKTEDAMEYMRKSLELDPDLKDARYFLTALEKPDASGQYHIKHVTDMFDDFAERFDDTLTNKLGYNTPTLIRNVVAKYMDDGPSRYSVFDAGCGTGLCGPLFRDIASILVGVDLSPRMIDQAKARNVYDELIVGEIAETLNHGSTRYDLIIAADVFVYIGDLSSTFKACHQALDEGGYFIFSTESEPARRFVLRGSGRYAHSDEYIRELAGQHGFGLVSQEACVLRQDYGKPIPGSLHVLRKT